LKKDPKGKVFRWKTLALFFFKKFS